MNNEDSINNEDLDAALLEWDAWRESNIGSGFSIFAEQHNLSASICTEMQRILSCGNDIGKMAFDANSVQNDREQGSNSGSCSKNTKGWLTDELGDRFDIKSSLGVGGMGTVWLAEQNKPIRRKVAIKLIRNDLVSPGTRKRFDFEQQALASMSHRNIATVHEAGETPKGRPYFIMEYIPGETITDFCNRRKLDLLERLQLFLQVCDGVQYAHRRGLIHRDLKPGNVLVMEENEVPVAKVIDFGLAKDTARLVVNESLTYANAVIGSPAWMSPEQAQVYVDGDKVEVDTRTDVFSLGIILYQLLANSTPISKQFLRESPPAKVFDAIRNQLPIAPSRRLGEQRDESKGWLENSSDSSYSNWVSSLKDDLDWVVMKAIEKDVSRRYENIGEFASDIKRFIDGESVTARPPSKLYHFKKIVGRNRLLACSIAAITTTLIVATCISLSYAVKANRAQQLAERRLKGSEQLTEVFASSFDVLSYYNDSIENTELKKKILGEFGKQMEITAAAFPADLPPKELAEREYLWRLRYVDALNSAFMDDECIEQLNRIIELLSPIAKDDDERLVDCRIKLSNCLVRQDDLPRAKQVTAQNLLIVSEAYPPQHHLCLRSEMVWLRAFINDRTFEENESKFKDLVERADSSKKGVHYQIQLMKLAAKNAFNVQEKACGIDWLDRAQKLAKEKLDQDSPQTVDLEFEYWLQVAFSRSGRPVDLDLLESRIRALSDSLGETHPTVIQFQITYARILNVLSHFGTVPDEKPIAQIRKTLATSIESLGVGHPQTSEARSVLLRCLSGAGKYQELLEACSEHLELLKEYSSVNNDYYRNSIEIYLDGLLKTEQFEILVEKARLFQLPREEATALLELGRFKEATLVIAEFIESKDPKTKEEFAELVTPYMMLAEIAFRSKNISEANDFLIKADEIARNVHPANHQFRLQIKANLLRNYRRLRKPVLAIQQGKELLDILLNQGNTMSQELRASLYHPCLGNLVELHALKRDFHSARQFAELYFDSPIKHKAVQSQDHLFKAYLGNFEIELGNDEKAEQYLLEALEASKSANVPGFKLNLLREQTSSALRKLYRRQGKLTKLPDLEK